MPVVSISEAKASFSELVNRATFGHERIVLTSHGQPKAALISIEDLKLLEELEEAREAQMLAEAMASEKRFYSVAEVEAELADLQPDG